MLLPGLTPLRCMASWLSPPVMLYTQKQLIELEEREGEEWRFLETGKGWPRFSDTQLGSSYRRPSASFLSTALSSPMNGCGRNEEV
jgi:hypothetical protein